MNTQPRINIDALISKAKAKAKADSRHSNRGRPKTPFPPEEAKIIGQMRKHGIALKNIHAVMKEEGLTRFQNYGTLNAAWTKHKSEKN